MIAFLIEVVKALVTFFAVCVGLGNFISGLCSGQRSWLGGKKTEQRETRTGGQRGMKTEFFQGSVSVRDWGHSSNQDNKGRRNKRSTLFAAWLHSDYNGSSCTA